MLANYKIWPLVNMINFKLVPGNLRVLFGNLVGIAWTAILISLTSAQGSPAAVAPVTAIVAVQKQ